MSDDFETKVQAKTKKAKEMASRISKMEIGDYFTVKSGGVEYKVAKLIPDPSQDKAYYYLIKIDAIGIASSMGHRMQAHLFVNLALERGVFWDEPVIARGSMYHSSLEDEKVSDDVSSLPFFHIKRFKMLFFGGD